MTKGEQARLTAWRWKVLKQAADVLNVARVCRHFGISRKSFYKWKRRHADHGAAGLCDRPRTPHRSPRATSRDSKDALSATMVQNSNHSSIGTWKVETFGTVTFAPARLA